MAVEVASGSYAFRPQSDEIEDSDISSTSDTEQVENSQLEATSMPTQQLTFPFRYGMLHDLESIWWIAVWWLCRTIPAYLPFRDGDHPIHGYTALIFPKTPGIKTLDRT